jgi:CelD/BcsL family acetyltransferase involved in cellulose biosynthesis
MATVSASVLTARVIDRAEEWDDLRQAWSALFAASPHATPPLDFAWLNHWWRIYGPHYGRGGLRVITLWRGSRLVGGLPLYAALAGGPVVGLRRLRFLSTGEAHEEETCPEYLGLLCAQGEEQDCTRAAWDALARLSWDHLDLLEMLEKSPLLTHGPGAAGGCQVVQRGVCPLADLTGGFDAYLMRLQANTRQQSRRMLREAEKAGVSFELAGETQGEEFLADLIRLHQARWNAEGQPGCFAAPRFVQFHRALIEEWLPRGKAALGRLLLGGQTVAALYGFVVGSKYDSYQSGVRIESVPLRSPGVLAHLMMMQRLIDRGVTCYDFLRGDANYKERLRTGENRLFSLQMWQRTWRAAAYRSVRHLGRRLKNGLRRLRGGAA